MCVQRRAQFFIVLRRDAAAREYDDVETLQQLKVQAKTFAHYPFDAIPVDGTARMFLGYRQPDSRQIAIVSSRQDCHTPVG